MECHKTSKHPKEYQYQVKQEAYIAKHPFECKHAKCKKRFKCSFIQKRSQIQIN